MEINEVKEILRVYDHAIIKVIDIDGKELKGEFHYSEFTGADYNKKTNTLTFFTDIKKEPKKRGRKPGVKIGRIKPPTVRFYRRVTPEEYKTLDTFLKNMRTKKN